MIHILTGDPDGKTAESHCLFNLKRAGCCVPVDIDQFVMDWLNKCIVVKDGEYLVSHKPSEYLSEHMEGK